jgi:hypothetical protein
MTPEPEQPTTLDEPTEASRSETDNAPALVGDDDEQIVTTAGEPILP